MHEINAGQELICRINAVQTFAFDIHERRKSGTHAEEYGIIGEKFIDRDTSADYVIQLQINAEFQDLINLIADDILGKSE